MYIIAEHVVEGHWENHYDIDPGESGLHTVHSAHRTIEGQSLKAIYNLNEFDLAVKDCDNLNKRFPNKGYGVVRSL